MQFSFKNRDSKPEMIRKAGRGQITSPVFPFDIFREHVETPEIL